jgi:hypothetical protein
MEFSSVKGFGLFDFTFGIYGGISMTAQDYKFGIASLFRFFPVFSLHSSLIFFLFHFSSFLYSYLHLKWGLAWSLRTYISHIAYWGGVLVGLHKAACNGLIVFMSLAYECVGPCTKSLSDTKTCLS